MSRAGPAPRVLKRLSLLTIGAHADPNRDPRMAVSLDAGASLRDALTLLLVNAVDVLAVTDGAGRRVGPLSLARIREAIRVRDIDPRVLAAGRASG